MKKDDQLVEACNNLIDWTLEQSAVMARGFNRASVLDMLNGLRDLVEPDENGE